MTIKILNHKLWVYLLSAFLLVHLFSSASFSHPHAFISNTIEIIFDEQGMAGLRVHWNFDEFFSNMIAEDYDRNENGRLDSKEIASLKKEAFSNLANFNYFTYINIDGKPFDVKYVQDFSAILSNNRLVYKFQIPCHVKALPAFKEIKVSQYDSSYYSYVGLSKKNPVLITGNAKNFDINHSIAENKNKTYYYGMMHPVEVIVRFKLKK